MQYNYSIIGEACYVISVRIPEGQVWWCKKLYRQVLWQDNFMSKLPIANPNVYTCIHVYKF